MVLGWLLAGPVAFDDPGPAFAEGVRVQHGDVQDPQSHSRHAQQSGPGGSSSAPDPAAEPDASDRSAIRAVIAGQLAAFQADDAAQAFSYASPAIQDLFGTPDVFMAMVRQGYQAVYRPRSFAFGALETIRGVPTQAVQLTGPDGSDQVALYRMQRIEGLGWRIAGVVMLPFAGEKT